MRNMIPNRKEKGFTLIELVMVIVILGILAAFALPRFADFGTEARVSSINGLAGSMRSAASIAHARQLADGSASDADVILEGVTIDMVAGYPTADENGIEKAAQISSDYSKDSTSAGPDAGDSIVYYIAPDEGATTTDAADQCRVKYTAANDTSGSEAPISVTVQTGGC